MLHTVRKTRAVYVSGFSLMEVLFVMGIFTALAGFGLVVSMETYRGSDFHADQTLLITLLQRARAQSINNMCYGDDCTDGQPHGVHVDTSAHTYTLFQGFDFASRDSSEDAVFDADPAIGRSGSLDVVFGQLTGTTPSATSIVLSGNGHVSEVTISMEGRISWTN